jgi:hypothetical protein
MANAKITSDAGNNFGQVNKLLNRKNPENIKKPNKMAILLAGKFITRHKVHIAGIQEHWKIVEII